MFRIGSEGEEDQGKSEKLLNSLGIAVRDTSGNFLAFDDIMRNLNSTFEGLNSITQQNIAQTLAGTYHYSKFLNIMSNFDIVMSATAKSLDSQNSALVENQKYLDSVVGRWNILKTTMQGVYASLLSSDALKVVISGLTQVVQTTGRVTTGLGGFKTALLALTVVIAILARNSLGSLIVSLFKLGANMNLLSASVGRASASMTLFTLTTAALKASLISVGTAMKAFFLNPVTWIIAAVAAVTIGIGAWINHQQKLKAEISELNKVIKEQADALDQMNNLTSQFDSLTESIKDAKNEGRDYTDSQVKLEEVQRKIAALLPETISGLDELGVAYSQNRDIIEEVIKKKKEDLLLNANAVIDKRIKTIDDEVESLKKLTTQYNTLADAKNNKKPVYKDFNGDYISEKSSKYGNADELVPLSNEQLSSAMKKYNDQIKTTKDSIEDFNKKVEESNDLSGKQVYQMRDINGVLQTFIITTKAKTDTTEKDNKSITKITSDYEELAKTINSATSEIKELNEVIDKVNKKQSLTAEDVLTLISKYPLLATAVKKTADGYTIEAKALNELRKVEIQHKISAIEANIGITNATTSGLATRLEAYGIEIAAIQSLSAARLAQAKVLKEATTDGAYDITNIGGLTKAKEIQNTIDQLEALGQGVEQINVLKKLLNDLTLGIEKDKGTGEKTSNQSINDKTDIFIAQMSDVNDILTKSDKSVKTLQDNIKSLFNMGDKNSLTKSLKEQEKLVSEYAKKSKTLDTASNSLNKVGTDLTKAIPTSLSKLEQSKYQSALKGQDVLKLTDTDRQRLTESIFPASVTFAKGDAGAKDKEAFDNRRKQFVQYLSDIGNLQSNIGKVESDKLANKNDTTDSMTKLGEMQATALTFSFDKTISDSQHKLSLLGNIDTDKERQLALKYTSDIAKATSDKVNEINKTLPALKIKYDNGTINATELAMLKAFQAQIITATEEKVKTIEDVETKISDIFKAQADVRKTALDKEYSDYEAVINKKLELIDQEIEKEDYLQSLRDKTNNRQEIVNQLNLLQRDNSFEAKSKRADLQKQLDGVNAEISKTVNDKNIQNQKGALQSSLDSKKSETDAKTLEIDNALKESNLKVISQQAMLQGYFTSLDGSIINLTKVLSGLPSFADFVKSENTQTPTTPLTTPPKAKTWQDFIKSENVSNILKTIKPNFQNVMSKVNIPSIANTNNTTGGNNYEIKFEVANMVANKETANNFADVILNIIKKKG